MKTATEIYLVVCSFLVCITHSLLQFSFWVQLCGHEKLETLIIIKPHHICLNSFLTVFPPICLQGRKSTADRTFSLSALNCMRNKLPTELRNTKTLIDFKRKIKHFNTKNIFNVFNEFLFVLYVLTIMYYSGNLFHCKLLSVSLNFLRKRHLKSLLLHYTILYYIILSYLILYYITLYYIISYHTILYYIIFYIIV